MRSWKSLRRVGWAMDELGKTRAQRQELVEQWFLGDLGHWFCWIKKFAWSWGVNFGIRWGSLHLAALAEASWKWIMEPATIRAKPIYFHRAWTKPIYIYIIIYIYLYIYISNLTNVGNILGVWSPRNQDFLTFATVWLRGSWYGDEWRNLRRQGFAMGGIVVWPHQGPNMMGNLGEIHMTWNDAPTWPWMTYRSSSAMVVLSPLKRSPLGAKKVWFWRTRRSLMGVAVP